MPFTSRGFESSVLIKRDDRIQSSGLKGEHQTDDQGYLDPFPSLHPAKRGITVVIDKVLHKEGGAGSGSRLREE